MRAIILACILFATCDAFGQVQSLALKDFYGLVKQHHPIAQRANLASEKAKYTFREALGQFDPKILVEQEQKVFNNQTYYSYFNPELKLPLWFGMEAKAAYTSYTGDYVNPENKVPKEGLGYIGLSMSLGKGLWLDERRAALKQARIYQDVASVEQQQEINTLLLDAAEIYADWTTAWLNKQVYEQAVALAERRFLATRVLFKNGDKPAIDTLEALTLLQSRMQKLNEYEVLYSNHTNEIKNFILQKKSEDPPVTIQPDTSLMSVTVSDTLLLETVGRLINKSPEVRAY